MSIKHLQFEDSATIAGSSLTNSYQPLLELSDDCDIVFLFNTTDGPILLRVPSGAAATKEIRLPMGSTMSIDARGNSKRLAKGTISVKYAAGATSSGEVTITVAR